jgi:UDP-glucose 4-epimerase
MKILVTGGAGYIESVITAEQMCSKWALSN